MLRFIINEKKKVDKSAFSNTERKGVASELKMNNAT